MPVSVSRQCSCAGWHCQNHPRYPTCGARLETCGAAWMHQLEVRAEPSSGWDLGRHLSVHQPSHFPMHWSTQLCCRVDASQTLRGREMTTLGVAECLGCSVHNSTDARGMSSAASSPRLRFFFFLFRSFFLYPGPLPIQLSQPHPIEMRHSPSPRPSVDRRHAGTWSTTTKAER